MMRQRRDDDHRRACLNFDQSMLLIHHDASLLVPTTQLMVD
jgi:hypothetical protein